MSNRKLIFLLITLISSILVVSDAFSQVGGGFGGGLGGGMGGRSHGNRNSTGDQSGNERKANAEKDRESQDPASFEQINNRLSIIQQEIKLEPEQLGAWLAFASKVRAYAADQAREKSLATASSSTLQAVGLQHIRQTIDVARNDLAALENVEASAKTLYAMLKPEQRILLDMRIPAVVAPRATTIVPATLNAVPPDYVEKKTNQ